MTYQLSSVGAGRGKDAGPFFSHRPEDRLSKATIQQDQQYNYEMLMFQS